MSPTVVPHGSKIVPSLEVIHVLQRLQMVREVGSRRVEWARCAGWKKVGGTGGDRSAGAGEMCCGGNAQGGRDGDCWSPIPC